MYVEANGSTITYVKTLTMSQLITKLNVSAAVLIVNVTTFAVVYDVNASNTLQISVKVMRISAAVLFQYYLRFSLLSL